MQNRQFLLLLTCLLLVRQLAWGHDSDKAFFTIHQEKETVVIEAEFPWTIRNSLIENAPYLNNSSSQEAFDKAFEELIKQNLLVYGIHGEQLPFVRLEEINSEVHSHSYKYKLVYKGSKISKIKNTLLFNIFDNSQNYHYFVTDKDTLSFETTQKQAIYSFPNTQTKTNPTPIFWGIVLGMLLLVVGLKRTNLMKSKK